mmetsp:Transcript_46318/g.110255  ORF Transcript_46318/g.110255 Transcript_46318/m.110255 type:complete len:278 (+) Transcript_46318:114-947(+)|eukprot:CAMPEP_0178412614 /NCGR_PEP_ID=MMETSP0689_2-20121128/22105_1 /TAXON_ID=160604 /ORGANISM="Amphidinium massartii, Strain CS-259" /LENGTH=277 /DNA_ID=CAMNT_0020033865 /DNA_START=73 /DNA_END=906 /DNA_ORIENTATION=-
MYPFNWRPERGLLVRPPGQSRRPESPTPLLRVDCADVITDAKMVLRKRYKDNPRTQGPAFWAEKVSAETEEELIKKARAAAEARRDPNRPPSAGAHMRKLESTLRSYTTKSEPCDEYHRYHWFHRSTLHPPTVHRGPEAKIGLGQRDKVWGGYASDYGRTNMDVEKFHLYNALHDKSAESSKARKEKHANRKSRSMQSLGVTTSLTGGSHVAMAHTIPGGMGAPSYRQIGLYEDSFPRYLEKLYKVPEMGLPSTDVTRVASELQKHMAAMRGPVTGS